MTDDLMNQAAIKKGMHSSSAAGKHKTNKNNVIIACIAAVVAAASLLAGGFLYYQHNAAALELKAKMNKTVNVDTFYKGIVVQGVDLGGKTMEEAKAAVHAVEPTVRGSGNVKVKYKNKSWDIGAKDLSYSYNTDTVLKEAYSYARTGELEARYEQVQALIAAPKKYSITAALNLDSVSKKVSDIAKQIERSPKDASIKSYDPQTGTFAYTEGQSGLSVNTEELTNEVGSLLKKGESGEVEIKAKETSYLLNAADLQKNMKRLGTYSTTSTNTASGNHNMELALKKVNGTVVPAGGTFSYLNTVGNPNRANGFLEAGAILNGKLIQSVGGGICQSSTTIYGAALRSNIKIIERYNHSIRSSYCPIGQDAAVSYGSLDFKFKNTSKYPIYIEAGMKGKVLTVTFYGWQSPEYDQIQVASQLTATLPELTAPQYTVDKTMKQGTMKLDAKARKGYKAAAQRIFYKNGKIVKTENLPSSFYRPSSPFYSIGPNTDPKSAKLVQGSPSSSKPASSSSGKPASSSTAPSSSTPSSSSVSSELPVQSAPDEITSASPDVESGIIIPD